MERLVDVYPYRFAENGPEFFLAKRAPSKQYAGQWRMIGGKVAAGETAWEAALRELEEETAMEPTRFWTVPTLNHFYEPGPDAIRLVPAFAAEIDPPKDIRLNEEHTEYKWIKAGRLTTFRLWPEQERIMTLIHRILTTGHLPDAWKIAIP